MSPPHRHGDGLKPLSPEILSTLDAALDEWAAVKASPDTIGVNPIVDAYQRYAALMHEHISKDWT